MILHKINKYCDAYGLEVGSDQDEEYLIFDGETLQIIDYIVFDNIFQMVPTKKVSNKIGSILKGFKLDWILSNIKNIEDYAKSGKVLIDYTYEDKPYKEFFF